MRSGINNKNQSLARSTIHRNATAIAVYIANSTFDIPLSVIAAAMKITFDRAVNGYKHAQTHVENYEWYEKMVIDYKDNIFRLLPSTVGILYKTSDLKEI